MLSLSLRRLCSGRGEVCCGWGLGLLEQKLRELLVASSQEPGEMGRAGPSWSPGLRADLGLLNVVSRQALTLQKV